jgi:hypothetical protein
MQGAIKQQLRVKKLDVSIRQGWELLFGKL